MISTIRLHSSNIVVVNFKDTSHSLQEALTHLNDLAGEVGNILDKYAHVKRVVVDNTASYYFKRI